MNKQAKTSTLFVRNIPITLKGYFKAYCAKKGKTMSEVILDYMKDTTRVARQVDEDIEYSDI